MNWEMEVDEIEAVLEKIWDLHDKLSDAIHSISRSHFLNSVKKKSGEFSFPRKRRPGEDDAENTIERGFVFMKEYRGDKDEPAVQEAKSLYAIRTALENLEDQLDFLHMVQTQQRAERATAVARLEQSRIVLAMRLAEHQGKSYKVIEEALALISDVREAGRLVTPENLYGSTSYPSNSNGIFNFFISGFSFVSKSLKLDDAVGIMGNAALFAISMLVFMRLNQVGCKGKHTFEGFGEEGRKVSVDCLDVMRARG